MGALGNAFRKLMGGGGVGPSGGLVMAAQHYARVDQTWQRAESFGTPTPVAPRQQPPAARSQAQAAAERPDLANWDLPPGLASVVQAERSGHGAAHNPSFVAGAKSAARRRDPSFEYDDGERAMTSDEMESLLERLAD